MLGKEGIGPAQMIEPAATDHPTPTEVELLIYARLIYITLFQTCFFTQLAAFVHDTTGQHLSVLKAPTSSANASCRLC